MQQDYNNTINLPKTEFPMRAGLPKREPGFLENWEKNDLYHELMKKNEGKPLFVLHDGPPYANGNLHMGHALNKILKDFILRSRNMMGYQAPYIPGWDTHGLPIERQAIKAYGMDRSKVSTAEFRSKCEEFAHDHVNTQRTQFKRLGVIGDWDRPYLTLTHDYEAAQIEIFGEMAKKGYIYKGQKPVYWCPHDETALAEAEIEYKDVPCKSIFVKFAVTDDKGVITKLLGTKENVYFVIWTTTTWTIPGNLAISLNPNFEYDFVKVPNGEIYVLAKELVASVMKTAGIDSWEVLATVLGSDLELIKTKHPLFDRDSLVITGDHVTLDAGTGCVHTAPGFGADDFIVCQRYNIPIIVPVDGKGRHTAESGKYEGMFVDDSNEVILKDLDDCGALLATEDIVHSYPHCWRCKKPVIFRATTQWFVSMEANELRQKALKAIRNDVEWIPSWGEERIYNMIEQRPDWCISRQRLWGVPILALLCEDCGEAWNDPEWMRDIAARFAKHPTGCDYWYEADMKDIVPEGLKCPKCGGHHVHQDENVLDTWFSSQLWTFATQGWPQKPELLEGHHPTTALVTARDIIALWVARMVMSSLYFLDEVPFKDVVIYPTILAKDGSRMSKSKGNGVDPMDLIGMYGADAMRYNLLTLCTNNQDVKFDANIDKKTKKLIDSPRTDQAKSFVTKIWNASRFLLMNMEGYTPGEPVVETPADAWMFSRLAKAVKMVTEGIENYTFGDMARGVQQFFWNEVCDWYVEVTKARLKGEGRLQAQRNLIFVLDTSIRLMHPLMPFVTEEIWDNMPASVLDLDAEGNVNRAEALMIAKWPEPADYAKYVDEDAERAFELCRTVVSAARATRSRYRLSPKAELDVVVRAGAEDIEKLESLRSTIEPLANTASLVMGTDVEKPAASIAVVDSGVEVFVVLEGKVDLSAEKARLEKEIAAAQKELAGCEKTLANEGFVAKAAPAVVQKKRDRAAELKEILAALTAQVADFS